MEARYLLCTNDELQGIIDGKIDGPTLLAYKAHISMALELQEYRKYYGVLGTAWLSGPGCGMLDCGVCNE